MRLSTIALAAFVAVILVGCTESEANEEELILKELQEQMEYAEQEVAEAVREIRDGEGDLSRDVRERIDEARKNLDAVHRKLEDLHRERRDRYDEDSEESGSYSYHSDGEERERVRIRVGDGARDSDRHDKEYNEYTEQEEHHSKRDRDHEYDIEIDIDEEAIEDALSGLGQTLARVGEALNNQEGIPAVDRDDLRDLFPREVAGMERRNIDSSTEGAFGIHITQVEAEYRGQRTDLELTVVDLGTFGGFASDAMDRIDAKIDRDSDDEYVRSVEIDGHPGQIHFERGSREDELTVAIMVAERFVVAIHAEGTDLDESLIGDILDDFRLDKLENLAR